MDESTLKSGARVHSHRLETFPLVSKRAARQKRAQTVQHMIGAIILITTGLDHFSHGGHRLLPVLEIVAGAALISTVIRERIRHHSSGGIAWVEFAGAVMLFVEAIVKLGQPHHLSFYVLSFIPPVMFLGFALFDSQLSAMRRLSADEDSLRMQIRPWKRTRVLWSDVASWMRTSDSIDVSRHDGTKTRFRFKDVLNREEAMEWAIAQLAQHASAAKEMPGSDSRPDQGKTNQPLVAEQRRAE
jgi:hypothetical protein